MNQQIGRVAFGPPAGGIIDLLGPRVPEPEIALPLEGPPLVARHERALPPGLVHAFCTNPACKEAERMGRPRYIGINAPGGEAQCRVCGQWSAVPATEPA